MLDNILNDLPVDPIVLKIGIPLALLLSLFLLKKLFKKILILVLLAAIVAGYFFLTADNPADKIQGLLQGKGAGLSKILDDKLNMSASVNGLPDAEALQDLLGDEAGKSINAEAAEKILKKFQQRSK